MRQGVALVKSNFAPTLPSDTCRCGKEWGHVELFIAHIFKSGHQPSTSSENQGDASEDFGGHEKGLTEVIRKPLIFLVGHR